MLPERAHSPIGPSSFARAEACLPSVIVSQGAVERESEYAAEGTLAHEILLERIIRDNRPLLDFLGEIPDDMYEAFACTLRDIKIVLGDDIPSFEIEIEKRLALPNSDMFGTVDMLWRNGGRAPYWVGDLKYGIGVDVPRDTPQVGLYGLMALIEDHGDEFIYEGDKDEILLHTAIFQPRNLGPSLKQATWTRQNMIDLRDRVYAVEEQLDRNDQEFWEYVPGAHCQFCAKHLCPALAEMADEAVSELPGIVEAGYSFGKDDLDRAAGRIVHLKRYIRAVEAVALQYLEAGGELTSVELTQKRPKRFWTDEAEARAFLERYLSPEEYAPETLISPAAAEKLLPAHARHEVMDLVSKESSGLTIAPVE